MILILKIILAGMKLPSTDSFSTKRCWSAARNETVLNCKEFISQRLHRRIKLEYPMIRFFLNSSRETEVVSIARLMARFT